MLSQQKSPQKFDGKLTRPTAETADSLASINVKERRLAPSQRKSPERKEEKKPPSTTDHLKSVGIYNCHYPRGKDRKYVAV